VNGVRDLGTELILLPSLRAQRGPQGGLVLTRKYMSGAAEYARNWPGKVTSLVHLSDQPTNDMDREEFFPGVGETGLELRPDTDQGMADRIRGAAAVLAFLSRYEARTARICNRLGVPIIFVSEYSPRTDRQILHAEPLPLLIRLRRLIWLWRTERIRRAIVPRAQGLQCSGTPTYDTYSRLGPETLMFFDNRVRQDAVISQAALAAKAASLRTDRPLRLVFGGRFVAMKGVLELPKVAAELARASVPFSFDVFGAGPLEAELDARIRAFGLGDRMRLRGVLDFETGWIPWLRAEADLFICCHPQGDPSSTYPEVMSCGVPIAGYDNEAFRGVVRHSQAGWIVGLGDAAALARTVAGLHARREEIVAAATRARDFAQRHAFEATFANRTAHIIRNSRLPEAARFSSTGVANP
jgi:glycosyltransferase involved in cell wall biosynthesis